MRRQVDVERKLTAMPGMRFALTRWRSGMDSNRRFRPVQAKVATSYPFRFSPLARASADGENETGREPAISMRNQRDRQFESTLLHHPVSRFPDTSENCSKSARVHAICDARGPGESLSWRKSPESVETYPSVICLGPQIVALDSPRRTGLPRA
jgi:hypothetical protein